MLLAHADGGYGRKGLAALDFFAHADLFMTPTAELADVVLPVASAFEREALRIGFEISEEAQSLVQLRQAVVPPPGKRARIPISSSTSPAASVSALSSGTATSRPPIARNWPHRRYSGAVARRARRRARAVEDAPRQIRRARTNGDATRICYAFAQD